MIPSLQTIPTRLVQDVNIFSLNSLSISRDSSRIYSRVNDFSFISFLVVCFSLEKFYKANCLGLDMNYEQLLDAAYDEVEECSECERFEILQVTGHHEGVRTIITNFGKVAACLRRDPSHLLKFLGRELGIQGEISGDRLVLSRKLSSRDVNAKVEKYAKRYVLCGKCGKPDTELDDGGGKLFVRCLACGNKAEVHRV